MKTPADSQTVMMQKLKPADADGRGIAYGDVCAGIAAAKHAGAACVTASVDSVHFFNPVKLGDMCIITATVSRAWNTSLEVSVQVESENMISGDTLFCCHAYLTFVAVSNGKPTKVPSIDPNSQEELNRYEKANQRREKRFQTRTDNIAQISLTRVEKSLENDCIYAQETVAQTLEIVFPEHANSLGITFGGQIIKWMEYCAAMAASRVCRSYLATASVDTLNFTKPTKVGDVVAVRAKVSAVFEHSCEVHVTVSIESIDNSSVITNDGWITFVAVNEDGQLVKCKKLKEPLLEESLKRREKRIIEKKEIALEYNIQ